MNRLTYPEPGSVVYVCFAGPFRHKGVVTDRWVNGKPTVIANAIKTKGVKEITWDQFEDARQVFLDNKPAEVDAHVVLWRARRLIGQAYIPLTFNCEHFVEVCYGKKPNSAQVVLALAGALALVGLLAMAASEN